MGSTCVLLRAAGPAAIAQECKLEQRWPANEATEEAQLLLTLCVGVQSDPALKALLQFACDVF